MRYMIYSEDKIENQSALSLALQVFEGTSGIDNKHTTIEFTGEVIQSSFFFLFLEEVFNRFLLLYACSNIYLQILSSFSLE